MSSLGGRRRAAPRASVPWPPCCSPTGTSGPRSTPAASCSTRTTTPMVQPSSVDVRIDRFFRLFDNHKYPVIDPSQEQPELTRLVEVEPDEAFVLHPGEFVLASTFEVVTLPDDVAARLEGKSSLGRLGLLTHSTAGFIDPGFSGHVTLELSNVATLPIKLWPGMKIGQLCFFRLSSAAGEALRQHRVRLALPGSARPHRQPLVPLVPPHHRVDRPEKPTRTDRGGMPSVVPRRRRIPGARAGRRPRRGDVGPRARRPAPAARPDHGRHVDDRRPAARPRARRRPARHRRGHLRPLQPPHRPLRAHDGGRRRRGRPDAVDGLLLPRGAGRARGPAAGGRRRPRRLRLRLPRRPALARRGPRPAPAGQHRPPDPRRGPRGRLAAGDHAGPRARGGLRGPLADAARPRGPARRRHPRAARARGSPSRASSGTARRTRPTPAR